MTVWFETCWNPYLYLFPWVLDQFLQIKVAKKCGYFCGRLNNPFHFRCKQVFFSLWQDKVCNIFIMCFKWSSPWSSRLSHAVLAQCLHLQSDNNKTRIQLLTRYFCLTLLFFTFQGPCIRSGQSVKENELLLCCWQHRCGAFCSLPAAQRWRSPPSKLFITAAAGDSGLLNFPCAPRGLPCCTKLTRQFWSFHSNLRKLQSCVRST